jgi:hypothetical protein
LEQDSRKQRNEGEDIEQEDGWSWVKAHDLGSFAYQLVQCALLHVVVDGSLWEMVLLLMMMMLTMLLRSVPPSLSFPTLSSCPSPELRLLRRQRLRQ